MKKDGPEAKHARQLSRILRKAVVELAKLNRRAHARDIWPNTTEKAYVSAMRNLAESEIRINAKSANII